MDISPFGIVYVIIYLRALVKHIGYPSRLFYSIFKISVISGIFLDSGYIVTINNYPVEYNYLASVMCCFASIWYFFCKKEKKFLNLLWPIVLFLFLHVTSVLVKNMLGIRYISSSYSSDKLWGALLDVGSIGTSIIPTVDMRYYVRFLMLAVNIFCASLLLNKSDIDNLLSDIEQYSSIYLIFLFVNFILFNFFKSDILRVYVLDIFGHSRYTISDLANIRPMIGIYTVLGLAREPSNEALTLFIILCILYYLYRINSINKKKVIICFFALIFTGALSAVGYVIAFVYMVVYSYTHHINIKNVLRGTFLALFSLIIAIAFVDTFIGRFSAIINVVKAIMASDHAIIFQSIKTGSSERLYSIFNNLTYFIKYPLFGTGLGTIYSYSAIITVIANLGIIGCLLYFYYYFACIKRVNMGIKVCRNKLFFFLLLAFALTGHMGYILYFEKTFLLLCVVAFTLNLKAISNRGCVKSRG